MCIIELPIKPNEITLDLLVKANEYLKHSFYHASKESSFDKMQSILLLDASIEYLLRIINYSFDIEFNTNKNFDKHGLTELAGEINKYLKETYKIQLPYITEIKLIRQARNQVQHAMMNPSIEFKRISSIAEKFFSKCLKQLYGLEINELSLSSLIKNEEIKQQLEKAEQYMHNGQYLEAIVMSRNAFENALYLNTYESNIRLSAIPCLLKHNDDDEYLKWFLKTIKEKLELYDLDINQKDYNRFKEYLGYIPKQFQKDWGGNIVLTREWQKKDAMFCYSFAIQSILQIQNMETPPINEIDDGLNYEFEEEIDNLCITSKEKGDCYYTSDKEDDIRLFVVNAEIKKLFDTLQEGQIYSYISNMYKNKQLTSRAKYKFKLLSKGFNLLTNEPERWEYYICFKIIPFTQYHEDLLNNKVVERTFNINETTSKEIYNTLNKFNKVITRKISDNIIKYIKKVGKITSPQELLKIEGIDELIFKELGSKFII